MGNEGCQIQPSRCPHVGARHGWGHSPFRLAHFLFTYTRTASMAGHIWKQKGAGLRGPRHGGPHSSQLNGTPWGDPRVLEGQGLEGKPRPQVTQKVSGRAWPRVPSSAPQSAESARTGPPANGKHSSFCAHGRSLDDQSTFSP